MSLTAPLRPGLEKLHRPSPGSLAVPPVRPKPIAWISPFRPDTLREFQAEAAGDFPTREPPLPVLPPPRRRCPVASIKAAPNSDPEPEPPDPWF